MEIEHGVDRDGDPIKRVGIGLLRAVAVALALAAIGPVQSALAEPPSVTIGFLPALTPTTPTIEGTAGTAEGDELTVTVYKEGGVVTSGHPSVGLTGEWTLPTGQLADGTYRVEAVDSNGVESTSAERSFRIDSTPPKVTINPVGSVKVASLTLSGGAGTEEGDQQAVTVTIYQGSSVGGPEAAKGSASVSGSSWSFSTPHLTNGTYTAQATQVDWVGNVGSAQTTFNVEVEAPKVTISPIPSPTTERTPAIKGTAGTAEGDVPEVSVSLKAVALKGEKCTFKEAAANVSATAGEWEYRAGPLCDGTYSVVAAQKNEAGIEGKSTPATFEVNTPAPAVTLAASPTTFVTRGKSELVSGAMPAFLGTATAEAEETKPVTVNIYKGATATGNPVKSLTSAIVGTAWEGAVPAPGLPEGVFTAQATQLNEAGKAGKSQQITFTVDAAAPKVTLTEPSNGQKLTRSQTFFKGAAGVALGDLPTVTLKVYPGETATGTPVATLQLTSGAGAWTTGSSGPRLPNGIYTARAEQSDDVHNVGLSGVVTFAIAARSPEPTLSSTGFVHRGALLWTGTTPTFTGTAGVAPEDAKSVTLRIYGGSSPSGAPVEALTGVPVVGATWTAGPVAALPAGTYTVQAEQADSAPGSEAGVSNASTFNVDAAPPQVTLSSPADNSSTAGGSQLVAGSAGTAEGDLPEVTVQLFAGPSPAGAPLQSIGVTSVGGAWSTTVAGLIPGTYTVRAVQLDDVGNVGSSSATFTVAAAAATPASGARSASFTWVPAAPHTGEVVSLLSSSSDSISPITAYSWDLAGNGAFSPGGPVMTTSFSTPGNHVVRLQIGDSSGLSNVASETIGVIPPSLPLMQPFPVVRITGTRVFSGVKLKLLSVQASSAARITVVCAGHGCPIKSQTRAASAGKTRSAAVEFRRLERFLPAGVTLEVRVTKPGVIGKYTRFLIRRGRLPLRYDACVGPSGGKPISCPPS